MKNHGITKIISACTLVSMLSYTLPVLAYTKEETVYSKVDAEGNRQQTVVSTHIQNTQQQDILEDISNLLNIENTNGYETFEKNGDTLVWKAEKKDIYYQGESKEDLPVVCNISYTLNGEAISAKEIAGKSGTVKIQLQFKNQEAHRVTINGKQETIYTPFLVISGMVIQNENNTNIQVTNGKIIDDGTKSIVCGVAFPGMQESLALEKEGITLPETIEIQMDTTAFEMGEIISYITPNLIQKKEDLEQLDKIDTVFEKVNTLQEASNQILEGAQNLKEGTSQFYEKKQEFHDAMNQITEGMSSANENYAQVNDGITQLDSSSKTLGKGAGNISEGTSQIAENLKTMTGKLREIEKGSKSLEQGEKKLEAGVDQLIAGVKGIKIEDNSKDIEQMKALIKQNETTITTLKTTNETIKKQLQAVTDATMQVQLQEQSKANTSLITLLQTNNQALQQTLATLQQTDKTAIQNLQQGLNEVKKGVTSLQQGNQTLTSGITQLKAGSNTLAEKTGELQEGAKQLYQGTKQLSQGTQNLKQGSHQMQDGLSVLDHSTKQLDQADSQLTDAAGTIHQGANELYDGIAQFHNEAIKPICNLVNGKAKQLKQRIQALGNLSFEYNNFTQLVEGNEGKVSFILLVEGIQKEAKQKEEKQDIILNKEETKEVQEEQENSNH